MSKARLIRKSFGQGTFSSFRTGREGRPGRRGRRDRKDHRGSRGTPDKGRGSLSRIVKVSVYLANADDFETFNRTYARDFKSKAPARVSVVTTLTIDATVEMEFVAYTGS